MIDKIVVIIASVLAFVVPPSGVEASILRERILAVVTGEPALSGIVASLTRPIPEAAILVAILAIVIAAVPNIVSAVPIRAIVIATIVT